MRIQSLIDSLTTASSEVLNLLSLGPKRIGDLLVELKHDPVNFLLTKYIGDYRGSFDNSPHQLALSDLIDQGKIEWWRDEQLDVWYGLKGTKPNHTGEDVLKDFFIGLLDRIDFVAEPNQDIPCELTRGEEQVCLSIENERLEIYAEFDCDYRKHDVAWPVKNYIEIANIINKLGKWSIGPSVI